MENKDLGVADATSGKNKAHVATIRAFRDSATLKVVYLATAKNPYRDHADIDIYDDENGFEYWIDAAAGTLVQAGPRAGLPAAPLTPNAKPDALVLGALRDKAVALVTGQVPSFTARRSEFHTFEDNRRNAIFFFRWEETGIHEFDLPPFLQVGLHADGRLACFTNTLEAPTPEQIAHIKASGSQQVKVELTAKCALERIRQTYPDNMTPENQKAFNETLIGLIRDGLAS